ncbi:MAG: hypothetical protein CM15mP46_1630 [Alphaproteobacteria bacterium]|nr:MAG: hypothetical protein CM15mP46_1630 [Alphaproteobacteria bacterium]
MRYALGAIKNVGSDAMTRLVDIRQDAGPFSSLEDLLRRLPREVINRRQMEGLVRAGAFDSLHPNRRELIENMDLLLSHADAMRREAESNQDNLFGGTDETGIDGIRLRPENDWAAMDRLKEEFDALGLYLSAHPLDSYASQLSRLRIVTHAALVEMLETGRAPQRVNLAGSVTSKQIRVSQRGNRFAFVQLTDQTGVFEVTMFSDVLAEAMTLLESEKPLLISANLKVEDNGPRLLAARVQYLDDAIAAWHGGVALWVQDEIPLTALKDVLRKEGPGKAEVNYSLIMAEGNWRPGKFPARVNCASNCGDAGIFKRQELKVNLWEWVIFLA